MSPQIDHYFCESCSEFPVLIPHDHFPCSGQFRYSYSYFGGSGCFVCFFVIILLMLRTHLTEGRRKGPSTCGIHITLMVLEFEPQIISYIRSPTSFLEDVILTVFYTIVVPMSIHQFKSWEMQRWKMQWKILFLILLFTLN